MNDPQLAPSVLRLYTSRRMISILLLGFSSGLPIALVGTGGTFQAWLTDSGLSLEAIGSFAAVALPYSLKFLWAPLLDRYQIFSSTKGNKALLHHRQAWMCLSQVLLIALLLVISFLSPALSPGMVFAAAAVLSFVSATQDIAVDAYRAEAVTREELGPAASVAIFGYRMAMLTSGAVGLSMGQFMPWPSVYRWMALVQVVGLIGALLAPAPRTVIERPKTLRSAVVNPLQEFFSRPLAIQLLVFIFLYKISDVMALLFSTRFMLGLGFQKVEIAAVSKGLGLVATIVGTLMGGAYMARAGMRKGLLVLGGLQSVSVLCFALLAVVGQDYAVMTGAIALENLCSGLGTAAFAAFLMSLCHSQYTATQYALFTSLAGLTRAALGTPCGMLVNEIGWPWYFAISATAGLPALAILYFGFGSLFARDGSYASTHGS